MLGVGQLTLHPFSFCCMLRIITSDSNAGDDHIHACSRTNIIMDSLFGNCTLQMSVDTVEVILCKYSRQSITSAKSNDVYRKHYVLAPVTHNAFMIYGHFCMSDLLLLAAARKLTASREILLWMTPSEAPKALQASECSELLDPMRASDWISAQH